MHQIEGKRYLFNASSYGLAGEIRAPYQEVFDVQAPNTLPITGGTSFARVENFNFKEILSFSAATTGVIGNISIEPQAKGGSMRVANTSATSRVEALNVADMVTVESVTARLTSRHVIGKDKETSVLLFGSHFRGLRIAGIPVEIELDYELIGTYDTYDKLEKDFRTRKANLFDGSCWPALRQKFPLDPVVSQYCADWDQRSEPPKVIQTSLVKDIQADFPKGITACGNVVDIPNFGVLHLAELFISEGTRRLTMMRFELGCVIESPGLMAAGIDGNGSGFP